MRLATCPQEEAVSEAARSSRWEESVDRHVAECQLCQEIVQTSRWMRALAEDVEGGSTLPDVSLLWWRAQLSKRRAKLERTQEAVEWLQIVSSVLVCAGLAGWLVWNWRGVFDALTWLSTDIWSRVLLAGYLLVVTAPNLFWPMVIVLSVATTLIAYPLFTEG